MFTKKVQTIGNRVENKDTIHITFGVDSKFIFPTGLAMTSIMKYNKNVMFHIFVDYVEPKDIARIEKLTQKCDCTCKLYYIDNTELLKFHQTANWNWATYLRFIAADYLSKSLSRVLYLDADVMCCDKLNDLYFTDFNGKRIAAVEDYFTDSLVKENRMKSIGVKGSYFNAGVLLIDLDRWKEKNITANALEMLKNDPKRWSNMLDQDVLNYLFDHDVKWLSQKYNMQVPFVLESGRQNASVVHFTGFKPWQEWYISEMPEEVNKEYNELYKESYWNDEPFWKAKTAFQYRLVSKKELKKNNYTGWILYQYQYLKRKIFKRNDK